ncbi:MAG: CRISPR-associated endonuclease Cas1 [Acidobacteria bacterium]|nr:CRISPR-associated endonuclease Cas1 [Acidobacteriota bacterium]
MRYLNTVYVREHRARVAHRRGSLLVSLPSGKRRVPLEAVDALVLLGGAQITTQAVDACVRRGVRVAALTMKGAVRFVVGGATSGNVHLRLAHYRAVEDEAHSLRISKVIVAAKLQNSSRVVGRWGRDERETVRADRLLRRALQIRERVAKLADASSPDQVRGIEGDAARIYFRALEIALSTSNLRFRRRNRRPPRDPVNAMLGFCYGLLVTELTGAVEGLGLDYQMGFLHRPRSGRPSLALDLAEELRALADRFVVGLVRRRQIGPGSFVETPGGGVYLTDDGRQSLIEAWERDKDRELQHRLLRRRVERWALPLVQATLLARHLRGDLPAYPAYVLAS